MSRHFATVFIVAAVLIALAILGGLVWANSVYVRSQSVEKDFLVPWLGARTFLQYGDSPYSKPATQRAQVVYYGRLAAQEEDPLTLWLPFPVELFYFPFALIPDYNLARAVWMTCLEIALAAMAFFSLRLIEWKPPLSLLPLVYLFFIFWIYGVLSLLNGSGVGYIALAMAGFLLAFRSGHEELAGGLFLLTAAVPSLTGLLVFFFTWWIFFRRRWRILAGLAMALVFLLSLSFLFIPNWFLPFVRGWVSHASHAASVSSVKIFASWSPVVGSRLGWVVAGLFLLLLCVEWGAAMRDEPRHVLWTACLTMAVMPFTGVPLNLANYVLLYVPLILLVGVLVRGRAGQKGWGSAGILIMGLFIGLWALTAILVAFHAPIALTQVLFLFLPLLIIPGLYWVRWRFIRAPEPELNISS